MRKMQILAVALVLPVFVNAGDPPQPAGADNPALQKDYAEFSKLVHRFVVKSAPKEIVHRDGWGQTIPLPEEKLILPRLRTYLKDGDDVVLPHGAWKRVKLNLEDPERDLVIHVKNFRNIDGKKFRLELDADVVLRAEGEWQQWQKGLFLVGLEGVADAYLRISVGSDLAVAISFNKIPPEVKINPTITELQLDLQDLRLRGGPIFTGEKGERLASEIKNLVRGAVRLAEPEVKQLVNDAIAQSVKDGKGAISAGELLKAVPPPQKKVD